jgi:hypothetical protein
MNCRQQDNRLMETDRLQSHSRSQQPEGSDECISFADGEAEFLERLQTRSDEPHQAIQRKTHTCKEPEDRQGACCAPVPQEETRCR